jgi:drug/metabolite transporter (DMT)-like permease
MTPGDHRPNPQAATVGLLIGLAGFAVLSCGDAITKSTVDEWPASAIATMRFLFGAIGLGVVLRWHEGPGALAIAQPGLQALRGLTLAIASFAIFMAFHAMPLANATSIQFANPAITAILSALLLGDRAPRSTWIASAVAFAGVLVILRPDAGGMGWAAGWPLLSAFGMASLMLLNRRAAATGSPLKAQYAVALFATPIAAGFAIAGHLSGWPPMHVAVPDWTVIVRCALIAAIATSGHMLIYLATLRASAATVAPTMYVQLLVALLLGALIFGDRPDPIALSGAALIVASGLGLFASQRHRTGPTRVELSADPEIPA